MICQVPPPTALPVQALHGVLDAAAVLAPVQLHHERVLLRAGLGHFSHVTLFCSQNTSCWMTPSVVHVTNVTPGSECDPASGYSSAKIFFTARQYGQYDLLNTTTSCQGCHSTPCQSG
jgi:hypothetical protein